jgi:hypothetical protein
VPFYFINLLPTSLLYISILLIRRTKRSFATAAVSSFTATGAPLGWHVLKLWRCVAFPPPRDAMLLSLAGEQGAGEARGGGSPTCRPATGSLTAFVGLMVTHPAGGRIARVVIPPVVILS